MDEVSASSGNLVLQISLPPGYHYTQVRSTARAGSLLESPLSFGKAYVTQTLVDDSRNAEARTDTHSFLSAGDAELFVQLLEAPCGSRGCRLPETLSEPTWLHHDGSSVCAGCHK